MSDNIVSTNQLEKQGAETLQGSETTNIANSVDTSKREQIKEVYVHKFNAPFEYGGKVYKEITFDFAKLKGKDAIALEDEIAAEGRYVLSPELSEVYLSKLAVRASDPVIGFDAIMDLKLGDFKQITNAARSFLARSGF